MKAKTFLFLVFALFFSVSGFAQNTRTVSPPEQPNQPSVSMDHIYAELTKISKSLQVFNKNFKEFVENPPQASKYSEKQQNLLVSFEVLNRAEERVQILQKFQIELTEKQATVRTRLMQVEQEVSPEGIERMIALLGTTRTEEYRESRRTTLNSERISLRQLAAQINQNLSDTNSELQQAALFVRRLRAKILPQIEQEVTNY
jgi:hypothetical protein